MNNEIRTIIQSYINENDYEKALSLLNNLPLEEQDNSLLELCKKGFSASCTSSISKAVKEHDRATAEHILSTYKKLLGEDANTMLFQTLLDNIEEKKVSSTGSQNNMTSFDFTRVFKNCVPDEKFMQSKTIWVIYSLLALVVIACGLFANGASVTIMFAATVLSVSLFLPSFRNNNKQFSIVSIILLLIPPIAVFVTFNKGLHNTADYYNLKFTWLCSLSYLAVYNILTPYKTWKFRIISSLLLFTILNPIWYGTDISWGIERYWEYDRFWFRFTSNANFFIILSLLATQFVYLGSFIGFRKICCEFGKILSKNKKQIVKIFGIIVGILILTLTGIGVKSCHEQKVAQQKAIEQAHKDSIQAIKNAIAKAKQDSIAAVNRRLQEQRDSIDYVEHAGFVTKYANIGLIINEVTMTRGQNDDGINAKGVSFSVFNPTHKTIKYVVVTMHAVDRFGDRLSYDQRCRGIGPVESHNYGSWSFDAVFPDKNDVIDDLSVVFQVVYTNGSSKTVRLNDARVSNFKESWFEGR